MNIRLDGVQARIPNKRRSERAQGSLIRRRCPYSLVAVVDRGPSAGFDSHFIAELKKLFNGASRYRRIFR